MKLKPIFPLIYLFVLGWILMALVAGSLTPLVSSALARNVESERSLPQISAGTSGSDLNQQGPSLSAAVSQTFVLGNYTFESGPEGWTGVDLTEQGTFFHVDDFGGLGGGANGGLTSLEGSKSLWCGVRTDTAFCEYTTGPGYGNSWNQFFESVAFTVSGDVTLSFLVRYDSEPGFDRTLVEYLDQNDVWVTVRTYDGVGDFLDTIVIPAGNLAGQVKIRFRFFSDGGWSDEDGLWATDGAVIIDDLTVADVTGVVDFQDFESEAVGALSTIDGDWNATVAPAFGDFAGLVTGDQVVQEDPCMTNNTQMWGFFNGSTADYGCGGFPTQSAVPYGPDANGNSLSNEIWSPPLDWTQDENGDPIPSTAQHAALEFDVYADLPLDALVFYVWHVRSKVAGCWGLWMNDRFVRYGGKNWVSNSFDIAHLIDPLATEVQVGVGVVDFCWAWCGSIGTGDCHSHAPLIDNVRLTRTETTGPQWSVRGTDLFQDAFAGDGSVTGTVRLDMAIDRTFPSDPNIILGDSAVVSVSARPGSLATDPYTGVGSAVYCHVKDVSPAKSGNVVTDDARWPVVSTGGGWTVVRFDAISPFPDRFSVDLNDHLYTPGDTIFYYFSAQDTDANTTYWSLHTGVTDSEAEVRSLPMEMTCLPANGLNDETDILFVDDADNRGAQPAFDEAFAALGLKPDRYDVIHPSSAQGNGLGGASGVKDVLQQLIPYYRTIIWNSGNLASALIGDGTGMPEKSDDFAVLLTFLQNRSEALLYISGDNIAQEWVQLAGTGATNLKNTYMNFTLVDGDHVSFGLPRSPLLHGQPGSWFNHGAGGLDALVADGDCPIVNNFDVLLPNGGVSRAEMTYQEGAEAGVLAQVTPNLVDSARVVLSGFSYHYIRDDVPEPTPDAVDHLRDILAWPSLPPAQDISVTVWGTVTSDCQGPLVGVAIYLDLDTSFAGPDTLVTSTDPSGNYLFESVPASSVGSEISILIPPGLQAVTPQNGRALIALDANQTVNFQLRCIHGVVSGVVTSDCPAPNTGLLGVSVDAFVNGDGDLVSSAVTDADGNYQLDSLAADDYTITIVTPLGYSAVADEIDITSTGGDTVQADFDLDCLSIPGSQRSIGFWKHQVGVATGGKGNAQIDGATLCEYLDDIDVHFNSNALNQVIVYVPPPSDVCDDKLFVAKDLLNLKGNVGMTARAKQQLIALLLNVAGGKLSLVEIISDDGATVSQAITHCDRVIDDPAGDHEQAKTICDKINNANMVPAGMIPLDTDNIAYSPPASDQIPEQWAIAQNHPNPFNPTTVIQYDVPRGGGHVTLRVYNVSGQLVRTLVSGFESAGNKSATWDATDDRGQTVSTGIYLYRLKADRFSETRKMLLLK